MPQAARKRRQEPDHPGLRSPTQDRSRATLDRIAAITEEMLGTCSFEQVTVAQVARRARSSIGAFYSRFRDKDSLLDYLDTVHAAEVQAFVGAQRARSAREGVTLASVIEETLRFLVAFHRRHRGVLRALVLRSRRHAGAHSDVRVEIDRYIDELPRLICQRRPEIDHRSPDQAVYLGFLMVRGALHERILFPDARPPAMLIADSVLVDELTRAYVGYLGLG